MTKFQAFIKSLNSSQLEEYATACKTTPSYITTHLIYAKKEPRKGLRMALAKNSNGVLTVKDVLQHFGIISFAA